MMRFFLFAVFILFFTTSTMQAASPVLRVGIDAPYPPFAFSDPATGKLTGFDYDIAVAVCKKIQRECDIQIVSFDEIIPRIVAGTLDIGVAGMSRTPEREEKVLFTEKYFRSNSIFIEVPGRNINPQDGLKGRRISVQHQTLQEDYLIKTYGDTIQLLSFSSFDELIEAVLSGKADLAFIDSLPAYHFLQSDEGQALDIVGDPVTLDSAQCIVLHKSLTAERDAINQAIQDLRSSGEYDVINRKYFDFNVY